MFGRSAALADVHKKVNIKEHRTRIIDFSASVSSDGVYGIFPPYSKSGSASIEREEG